MLGNNKGKQLINDINLTEEQMHAMDILMSGRNVFLSGDAGTGKSYVLNAFIKLSHNKKIIKCAPTGIAALNIDGATLHRVFKLQAGIQEPGDYLKDPSKVLMTADIIIIDEISMCRLDLFEYVINTILHMDNADEKQIILVGDFYQLPPVIDESEKRVIEYIWDKEYFGNGYPFNSKYWEMLNLESILLHNIVRQDDIEFARKLQDVRMGKSSSAKWLEENSSLEEIPDAIYLCARNDKANEINRKKTDEIISTPHIYQAKQMGSVFSTDKPTEDNLLLKVGMRIMTLANRPKEGYVNGTTGIISSMDEDRLIMCTDSGEEVEVCRYTWEIIDYEYVENGIERKVVGKYTQMPVKVAYAVTIHKSQGQTYNAANINPFCNEAGQFYVAISRVKNIKNVHFSSKIQRHHITANRDVAKFYRSLNK